MGKNRKVETRNQSLSNFTYSKPRNDMPLTHAISFCLSSYYHRSLNPKKLVETEFSRFPRKMTMARMIKMYKVPNNTSTPGLRPMTVADAPHVRVLLNEFLAKFDIAPIFTSDEEVTHWLVPVEGVVWSYVVEVGCYRKRGRFMVMSTDG